MIIWLASYPKSGNTWLRMFLKSYFQKSDTEFKLQDTITDDFQSKGFPSLSILKHLNIDYFKFSEVVKNWELMQDFINLNNKTNFVKTHNSMCTIGPYKFTSSRNTLGGIYLIRDPRDVLVSYSHHVGLDYQTTLEHMSSSDNYESTTTHKMTLLGSWADHYNSWKNYKSSKILIIKYEDMVLDTFNTFLKILKYLSEIDDAIIDENKIKRSLKQTEFGRLQKMEKKQGFIEKGKSELFFRKGKTGAWKNELSVDLSKKIEKKFNKEMVELGYL